MKKKIANLAKNVFAAGQIFTMCCSLCIICAYIVAFIAGGELAIAIDTFVYTWAFPKLYFIAISLAFVGAVNIYLTGHRVMRFEQSKE